MSLEIKQYKLVGRNYLFRLLDQINEDLTVVVVNIAQDLR